MRLSRILKLSFVGSLLFSPAMAQQANEVHEEALKVLRSGNASGTQPAAPAPAASSAAPATRSGESRAERQERLKAEARERLAERERQQAEKRRQFEEYVKERERLRSGGQPGASTVHEKALETLRQQPSGTTAPAATAAPAAVAPATPAPASPAPAAVQPAPAPKATPPAAPQASQPANDDVQQRALEIIRQQNQQPAATTAAPVRESELAPRTIASPAPASSLRSNNEDVHQKALEVLRQQSSGQASSPAQVTTQDDLKPSPELQRRLDEMNRELNTPQPRAAADPEYSKDLEKRAREMMQGQSAPATVSTQPAAPATSSASTAVRTTPPPAAAPAVDAQTRDILRRQDQQIRQNTSAAVTGAPTASSTLDSSAEARAREILRQQQQAVSNASAATTTTTPEPSVRSQPVTPAPAPASVAISSPVGDVTYSQDLENRARQMLQERGQPEQPAAEQQAAQAAAAAAASGGISTAPVAPNPELERVHSRAYETLVQVEPGESGEAKLKSKQQRLRALTDLYKADRMTPAEYHKRRAAILAEQE